MLFFVFTFLIVTVQAIDEVLRNGANDVVVVRRFDGSYASSRWEGQFGKLHSPFQSREGEEVHLFVNNVPARQRMEIKGGSVIFKGSSENYMTSKELIELNLNPGLNRGKFIAKGLDIVIRFSVFLYQEDDKLVITDIDGTISQSDVKGHIMPFFGWTAEHKKVVELFHKINDQGYKFIYLSARSFSQDGETKDYLFELLQDLDGYSLPQGPVMLSPHPFISSLLTEVVKKNPHEEKAETILDIWRAFDNTNMNNIMDTIVTAYGNKETDVAAYVNAGIDKNKIYIVDSQGHLVNIGSGAVSSYGEQVNSVHNLYPNISHMKHSKQV